MLSPSDPLLRAAHRGEQLGHFAPDPSLKGAPGGPMKGPLNTSLKDRYTLIEQSDLNTLIEQSDLNTLIEQSQYSSEEQCSKLIDKEIWLVMGSYCHCQQVVTFFFFFWSSPYNLGQGPLNFSGRPCLFFKSNEKFTVDAVIHNLCNYATVYSFSQKELSKRLTT